MTSNVQQEKKCTGCNLLQPLESFTKAKTGKGGRTQKCRQCNRAKYLANREFILARQQKYHTENRQVRRDYRKRNKEKLQQKAKSWQLQRDYGISLERFNLLLVSQNERCAICQTHRRDLVKGLAVDHDHTTGKVRALLCGNCNTSIGLLKEDPTRVLAVAEYLVGFRRLAARE